MIPGRNTDNQMQQQPHNPARSLQVTFAFAHGIHHGSVHVYRAVYRAVSRGVSRSEARAALGTLSSDGRATALFPGTCTVGLRALGLKNSVQVPENSPIAMPLIRCGRSRKAIRGSARGWQRRQLGCERSPKALPKMPAARSAPTPRPFPSLSLSQNKAGGSARFALRAPLRSRLGALTTLSARWGSLRAQTPVLGRTCAKLRWEALRFFAAFAARWEALANPRMQDKSARSLGSARNRAALSSAALGRACAHMYRWEARYMRLPNLAVVYGRSTTNGPASNPKFCRTSHLYRRETKHGFTSR